MPAGARQSRDRRLFLLDTNVVSELRRQRPRGAVLSWLRGTADGDLHLSAVTFGEIQAGIELTREQDPAKAAEIEGRICWPRRGTSCPWTAKPFAPGLGSCTGSPTPFTRTP
ncbi:MAG TPA: PIN domain-containing protein [Rhodocyclaceae bacterium]|nr:PIN domain-containing protein [Rhodocyclaceae bacterium]